MGEREVCRMRFGGAESACPVAAYNHAGTGYPDAVGEWLANPHAYFRSFGPEARAFQSCHRSERLRTMTLVAPAEGFSGLRPVCVCVDGADEQVGTWEQAFAVVTTRLMAAHPLAFAAMQRDGLLEWMGCPAGGAPVATMLETNALCPDFADLADVIRRVQWLFLMCGIRLNEVVVQVDPYTDGQWSDRKEALDRRRAEDKAFMDGRRAAQKAWAETHGTDRRTFVQMVAAAGLVAGGGWDAFGKENKIMKKADIKMLSREDAFDLIGKSWMLVTAGNKEKFNTMTASWGGIGWLWNRPVAFVFVRPERYTHDFIERESRLTLSFYAEEHRPVLQFCGTKSGRNVDKVKETGLGPVVLESGAVAFSQSRLTLDCRKLFKSSMEAADFVDKSISEKFYSDKPGGSFHDVYVVEIESVYA